MMATGTGTYIVRRVLRDGSIHEREKERRKTNPIPCNYCARTDRVQRIVYLDWMRRETAVRACADHVAQAFQDIREDQMPEDQYTAIQLSRVAA